MGYWEYGTYMPDKGWCDHCGKGMGGMAIERYANPRGNQGGMYCKPCFESRFADRADYALEDCPIPTNVDTHGDRVNWEYDGKKLDDDAVNGGMIYCGCTIPAKYFTTVSSDTRWVSEHNQKVFCGAPKCKHNAVDARTEWFKQHCQIVDAGGYSTLMVKAIAKMRWTSAFDRMPTSWQKEQRSIKDSLRLAGEESWLRLAHLPAEPLKNERGEFGCNSAWGTPLEAKAREEKRQAQAKVLSPSGWYVNA